MASLLASNNSSLSTKGFYPQKHFKCVLTKRNQQLKIIQNTYVFQKQPPEIFCKKGVLKSFAKCKGKHVCWRLLNCRPESLLRTPFFTEHVRWLLLKYGIMYTFWITTLIKRDSNTGVSFEICKIFKNSIFTEHLRWLFLKYN